MTDPTQADYRTQIANKPVISVMDYPASELRGGHLRRGADSHTTAPVSSVEGL
jgi:hypothetical protein